MTIEQHLEDALLQNKEVKRLSGYHDKTRLEVIKALKPKFKKVRRGNKTICSVNFLDTMSDVHIKESVIALDEWRNFKVGDKVRHNNRAPRYLNCEVVLLMEHRLPLIGVTDEEGYHELPNIDLTKI